MVFDLDEPRRPRWGWTLFVCAMPALPVFYAGVAAGPHLLDMLGDFRLGHLLLNAAATGIVMVWALAASGRFDRKLATVLGRVLLVHGVLAFIVLVLRLYHSNKVMLAAAATSAILGSLVMWLNHMTRPPRIALLGTRHELLDRVRYPVVCVEAPGSDLLQYDLLLTSDVVDLSPEWSGPVARAMLMGKQVRHLAEFVEEDQGIVSIEHFDLEQLSTNRLNAFRFRKRLMDITLVVLSLPLALPLLVLGALAILLTMGRPLLFSQDRVGLGGRTFRIHKLRTMRPARANEGVSATVAGDLRVTAVGKILRRFRIDELPQFWNVLKGDMSVIGPRPEQPSLTEAYVRDMPAFVYRSLVRPGITGWAQVRAGYAANLEETRTKLTYDLFYVKNFSFALDMQILIRTVWTLIGGAGVR